MVLCTNARKRTPTTVIAGILASAALTAAAQSPPSVADTVVWKGIGHGGGGSFLGGAVIDPIDPDIVLIGSDTGGVYRTDDGGKTWLPGNQGFAGDVRRAYLVRFLAMDPDNAAIVYIGAGAGLFKSFDHGEHWFPKARKSGSEKIMIAGTVDPNDSNVVYAADTSGKVYRSTDAWNTGGAIEAGAGFEKCSTNPSAATCYYELDACTQGGDGIRDIVVHPTKPGYVVVATQCGLFMPSDPLGTDWTTKTWTMQTALLPRTGAAGYDGFQQLAVADDGQGRVRLFAIADKGGAGPSGGIYVQSQDWDGPLLAWAEFSQGATPGPELVASGDFENCDAATCTGPSDCRTFPPGWSRRAGGTTDECLDCSTESGNCFLRFPDPVGSAAGAERIVTGLQEGLVYRLSLRFQVVGDAGNTGLPNPLIFEVRWLDAVGVALSGDNGKLKRAATLEADTSPVDPETWAEYWGFGSSASGTGGQWASLSTYLRAPAGAAQIEISFRASEDSSADTWVDDVSIVTAEELPLGTGRAQHELNRAGRTQANVPASATWYRQIAIGNTDPDLETIYVLTGAGTFREDLGEMGGVWKTTDGGASWSLTTLESSIVSDGASSDLRSGALDVSNKYAGMTLAVGDAGATDHVYMGSGKYVYKSADGGASWTETTSTLESQPSTFNRPFFSPNGNTNNVVAHSVATHPAHPDWILYDDADGHVSFSEDGGDSFSKLAFSDVPWRSAPPQGSTTTKSNGDGVTDILFDADDPNGNTIFVAVGTGSVNKFSTTSPGSSSATTGDVLRGAYSATASPRWSWTSLVPMDSDRPEWRQGYTQLVQYDNGTSHDLIAAVMEAGIFRYSPGTPPNSGAWEDITPAGAATWVGGAAAGVTGLFAYRVAVFGDRLFLAAGNPRNSDVADIDQVGVWVLDLDTETWTKISAGSPIEDASTGKGDHVISLHVVDDETLFVSTWRGVTATPNGKMYRVTYDSVADSWLWTAKLDQPKITSIVATPGSPSVMWAFSSQVNRDDASSIASGIHTSTDSGETWTRSIPFNGLVNFTDARMAFHAGFENTPAELDLFIATDGGGVWRGDLPDIDGSGVWDCLEDVDADSVMDCNELICGDANLDRIVNSLDSRLIQRCAVGLIPCPESILLCDASADGKCNSIDARLIQRFALGQVPQSSLKCTFANPVLDELDFQDLDRDGCPRWVEVTLTSNDSNPDSDGDGVEDCEQGFATDPGNPDTDSDGIGDGVDNCPLIANPGQAAFPMSGVGIACLCGDANTDGTVNFLDIFEINDIILGSAQDHDLADTNFSGHANLLDLNNAAAISLGTCVGTCSGYPPGTVPTNFQCGP